MLEERFVGGADAFLRHFFEKVHYPADAREHCRSGQLLVKVTVSPKGEIQAIQFLNKLGNGIEEEVETTIKATNGKWKTSPESSDLYFPIGFQLEGVAVVNGDLKVVAYGSGAHGGGCESTPAIEAKMDKAIKKGKKDKAIEYCEELLRRNPFSAEYIKAYNVLKGLE